MHCVNIEESYGNVFFHPTHQSLLLQHIIHVFINLSLHLHLLSFEVTHSELIFVSFLEQFVVLNEDEGRHFPV